jgi:hypothetical protein
MEQELAVAFVQHDPALAAPPARSRNPERIRQVVADRAELTGRRSGRSAVDNSSAGAMESRYFAPPGRGL